MDAIDRKSAVAGMARKRYTTERPSGFCEKRDVRLGQGQTVCTICRALSFAEQTYYWWRREYGGLKEYTKSPFISAQWKALRRYLGGAYIVTMFGYGAPKSDAAAVALMEEAWGDTANREFEQTEIIDIRDEDELRDLWDGFIHSHHYEVHRTIDESWICRHPRRSCETVWAQFMDVKFVTEHRPPATTNLSELQAWYGLLVAAERKAGAKT